MLNQSFDGINNHMVLADINSYGTVQAKKQSMNIRAAFLHNVSDALASVGVIIAGTVILLFEWYWSSSASLS